MLQLSRNKKHDKKSR